MEVEDEAHVRPVIVVALLATPAAPKPAAAQAGRSTPAELVVTYKSPADGILSLKRTEETSAARSSPRRTPTAASSWAAQAALKGGDAKPRRPNEALAASVASWPQRVTTRSRRSASSRSTAATTTTPRASSRIFDEGFVIVTKAAKGKLLASSRAIGRWQRLGRRLDAEWLVDAGFLPADGWPASLSLASGPCGPVGPALVAVRPRPGKVDAAEEASRHVDGVARAGNTRVLRAGRLDKDHLLDWSSVSASFLDYDRDGRLDVYLVNGWRLEASQVVEKGRNALYHGKADGSFEDATDAAGVGGEGQWAQGVAVADYDNDGWPDILVTTFGRNVLYRNLGNGRFQDVAKDVGIESPGWNTGACLRRRR